MITRLKLVGFIGILHGTGKNEIEIDFSKSKSKFLIFKGTIGSGKTTILSSLHPFFESFDARESPAISGRKELDIMKDGVLYEMVLHYKTAKKAFIKKNGIELNPSGGVRSYEEIILQELGIDQDFFKISKMGDNVVTFTEFSPLERKQYINRFIPNIDDILEANKIISSKFTIQNKNLSVVASKLDKIRPIQELEKDMAIIQEKYKVISEYIKELNDKKSKQIGRFQSFLEANKVEISKIELESSKKKLKDDIAKIKTIKEQNEELYPQLANYSSIDEIDDRINKLEKKVIGFDGQIESLNNDIARINSYIENTKRKLKDNKLNFDSIDPTVISTLEKILVDNEKKLKELKDDIDSYSSSKDIVKLADWVMQNFEEHNPINVCSDMFYEIGKLYQVTTDLIGINIEKFKQYFTADIKYIKSKISEISSKIMSMEEDINNLNKKLTIFEKDFDKIALLKLRPANCKDDTCPFIKDAIQFENLEDDIADTTRKISNAKKKQKELIDFEEELKLILSIYNKIISYFKSINDSKGLNTLSNYFGVDSLKNIIDILSEPLRARELWVDKILLLKSLLTSKFIYLESSKKLVESSKKLVEHKEAIKNKQIILDMIKSEEESLIQNEDVLSGYKEKLNTIQTEKFNRSNTIIILNQYKEYLIKLNNYNKDLELVEEKLALYANYFERKDEHDAILNELTILINNNEKQLSIVNKELDKLKIESFNRKSLEEEKLTLTKDFENIKLLKDALDVKKGMPLVFIKNFLDDIKYETNHLLSIAFNNKFLINDFILSDKEFNIEIIKQEYITKDISMVSQGEKILARLSLSLAMIKKLMIKNNINVLYLDEADGSLSEEYRSKFLKILDLQMEELFIEQTFIISHNDIFNSEYCDYVLLKGAPPEGDINGNIIYKLQ
jgi:DNA repair exonuclease SbcCD ATPase subunit